ncbi:MAG: endonuclease [Cellvibrionaceae bacterium]
MRILISLLLFIPLYASGQDVIQTYDEARDKYFWKKLYKNGGVTLYCDLEFDGNGDHKTKKLSVEHVMPTSWMAAHYGCKNRHACPVDLYQHAAADLHNLWPSIHKINAARNNLAYANIKDESHRIYEDICEDAERLGTKSGGLFEPTESARGEIARSLLYMELAYGLPLGRDRKMLLKWAEKDPVSEEELRRNKEIFKIQRRRNPYISDDEGKILIPTDY